MMQRLLLFITLLFFSFMCFFPFSQHIVAQEKVETSLWDIQCIDTMKTSRDRAREWRNNPIADVYIEKQVHIVKSMGANCIAISTPYDEEFLPILSLWVDYARQYKLRVWFRGNFSGWEGWFGYSKFSNPVEHHQKTYDFITNNPRLFQKGDIFTPAPEPENGVIGDPRETRKIKEFNIFLIKSYDTCTKAFNEIQIAVLCGYFSMNGDVAKEILTKETVKKTGNVIVIDHYVNTPERMKKDILYLEKKYDAPVVLGEYGAPIPDIHGDMNEDQQADFMRRMLKTFYEQKNYIKGVNYWTLYDGTTALLWDDYSEKKVTGVLKDFYQPGQITGRVTNTVGDMVKDVVVKTKDSNGYKTNEKGEYTLIVPVGTERVIVSHTAYIPQSFSQRIEQKGEYKKDIVLTPRYPDIWYKIRWEIKKFLSKPQR